MYFDGSDVGLADSSNEDVNAFDAALNGDIYLSTYGDFAVTGLSGFDEDVFICTPASLGDTTACNYAPSLYFDGSVWGLDANDVDGINLPLGFAHDNSSLAFHAAFIPMAYHKAPLQQSGPLTFTAEADSYVRADRPNNNYGTNTSLWTDGGTNPAYESYLKFTVSGTSGSIQSAILRVYATNGTVNTVSVMALITPGRKRDSPGTISPPAPVGQWTAKATSPPAVGWNTM